MEILDLEQGSEEWLAVRAGLPTASNFAKMITSTGALSKSIDGYATTLAAEMYAGKPLNEFEATPWMERGNELEQRAADNYSVMFDCDLQTVGFVKDGDWGCSPDRFVGDDGLVEIKCLKAENHIDAIMYHKKHGKIPTKYVQQVQGQMLICQRKWCDLVFYHPDLPLLTIRTTPEAKVVNGLIEARHKVIEMRDDILDTLNGL